MWSDQILHKTNPKGSRGSEVYVAYVLALEVIYVCCLLMVKYVIESSEYLRSLKFCF